MFFQIKAKLGFAYENAVSNYNGTEAGGSSAAVDSIQRTVSVLLLSDCAVYIRTNVIQKHF